MKNKGITLISLVITIIILLILAGIIINITIGESGIFTRAKTSKEKYLTAQIDEEEGLNELYRYLANEDLPENTKDTKAGTLVKIPDEWKTNTPNYISTLNGDVIKKTELASTVYAVSDGEGNTIPVPIDFWYVGGNLSTGAIISDSKEDRYGYNPETKKENDEALDKTSHEYATKLNGNQFVWIPCTLQDYKKTTTFTKATSDSNWGTKAQNLYYDVSTNSSEKTQIEKYGGYYVARYEAGTSNIEGINFSNITTTGWRTEKTIYTNITGGNITSKANEIPYIHSDYATAVEMCERMYRGNKYVNSGLITGTMWDVMINVMNAKTGCDLSSSNWGNYSNNAWKELRGSYCDLNSSGGHSTWSNANNYDTNINVKRLTSTGASNNFQKMHLYDVAGNLWEYTQEMGYNNSTGYFVMRGGSCTDEYSKYPVSFRVYPDKEENWVHYGFRAVLYIK